MGEVTFLKKVQNIQDFMAIWETLCLILIGIFETTLEPMTKRAKLDFFRESADMDKVIDSWYAGECRAIIIIDGMQYK